MDCVAFGADKRKRVFNRFSTFTFLSFDIFYVSLVRLIRLSSQTSNSSYLDRQHFYFDTKNSFRFFNSLWLKSFQCSRHWNVLSRVTTIELELLCVEKVHHKRINFWCTLWVPLVCLYVSLGVCDKVLLMKFEIHNIRFASHFPFSKINQFSCCVK